MPTVKRFEGLECWQKAGELTKAVYQVTCRASFQKDFALRDQIRRARVSIMLNIAEGFAGRTDREFRQFLAHAHGSCAEVQAALYVGLDQRYLPEGAFNALYASAEEVSKMMLSLGNYLGRRTTPSLAAERRHDDS